MNAEEIIAILHEKDRMALAECGDLAYEGDYEIKGVTPLTENATMWQIETSDNRLNFSIIEHSDGMLFCTDDWQSYRRPTTPEEINDFNWITLIEERPSVFLNGLPRVFL